MKYDFIVIGAGIAGLAIAELLQRSGRSVVLLEASDKICSESSSQQQGWFHTGALYAALPAKKYFKTWVKNLDDLLIYYNDFPNMNLTSGGHLLAVNSEGWFKNSTFFYFYTSPRDPKIPFFSKPLWYLATLRAQSRLSWFENLDFNRELISQLNLRESNTDISKCLSHRKFDFNLDMITKVIKSHDRTLDTELLINDLADSFINCGGEIKLNSKVIRIEKNHVSDQSMTFNSRHIVLTVGQKTEDLSGIQVKVVKSPLLIIKPALSDINFVIMSPVMSEAFNHVFHDAFQGDYSLIGSATYYSINQSVDGLRIHAEMVNKANKIFNADINMANTSLYFGCKTELTSKSQLRNYQYQIIDINKCVVALPGKLTLAFSLAVNLCKHFGIDPVTTIPIIRTKYPSNHISKPEHYKRFLTLL